MDIRKLERIAALLRSGANCADEAADLIDDAVGEIERLRGEVRVLAGNHEWITRQKERLEAAIKRTLDENGHLADGDDCTLIHLKRSMPTPE